MRLLYVSRTFNRSGYSILEHLIQRRRNDITAVLLPRPRKISWLDSPLFAPVATTAYHLAVRYYRCESLRYMQSIKLLCQRHGLKLLELPTLKSEEAFNVVSSLACDLLVLGGGWPEL